MRRRHRRALVAVCLVLAVLLAGGGILLSVRGDWRYRVLYALAPVQAQVLEAVEPDWASQEWEVAALVSDGRVTVEDTLLLINQAHPLEDGYEPEVVSLGDWRMTAATRAAFEALRARVECETGERLLIRSAYRSWDEQQAELARSGEAVAAQPGESEHEAGMALDVCVRGFGGQAFLKTAAGRLVNRTCAEEGFVVRYPLGKASVTGFAFEPWHLRYVGRVHAEAMAAGHLTLEEYILGMVPGQWYARGDVLILRSADLAIQLPTSFIRCTISPDGCGYWIYTVEIG